MIAACTCKHAGQDALHGAGKRVWNECAVKDKKQDIRCTVCGQTREIKTKEAVT